jgi:anti-sigma regulatory factor (Ser/Thr protein kinase)
MSTLAELTLASLPGNERMAAEEVARVVQDYLHFPIKRIERLKTAVAEAVMNAMEHGNQYQEDMLVEIKVQASTDQLVVTIIDRGGQLISTTGTPNLEAKLGGMEEKRGWGLFLIQNMVDQISIRSETGRHIVELIMYLDGEGQDG